MSQETLSATTILNVHWVIGTNDTGSTRNKFHGSPFCWGKASLSFIFKKLCAMNVARQSICSKFAVASQPQSRAVGSLGKESTPSFRRRSRGPFGMYVVTVTQFTPPSHRCLRESGDKWKSNLLVQFNLAYGEPGAILAHCMTDGSECPVGYASHSLATPQYNYLQLEREALALVFNMQWFHSYLASSNLDTDLSLNALLFAAVVSIPGMCIPSPSKKIGLIRMLMP